MKTLFLDLASHSSAPDAGACIACVTDEKTAAIRFVDHRIGDDALLPLLDEAMREAGWKDADLTNIACVTGPGGFTSLRMAVTLANVLADQLRIPLAGLHMSEVYAARVMGSGSVGARHALPLQPTSFIWIHATKKKELFVRGFGEYSSLWPEPILLSLEDLAAAYPKGAPFAGELLPEQRALIAPEDMPLSSLADTLPGLLRHITYANMPLTPWYGRKW
jgi:tRNA threonylcarbamoyl adenosine modification protein YeaZ